MKILSNIQQDILFDCDKLINITHPAGSIHTPRSFNIDCNFPGVEVTLHTRDNISIRLNGKREIKQSPTVHMILNIPAWNNYGHCLHDVIPKLMWYDLYAEADVIYTQSSELLQSLISLFKLTFNKIVFITSPIVINSGHVVIETHPVYHARDKKKIQMLKQAIDSLNTSPITTNRKFIYCTRNHCEDVKHGRKMSSDNEDQIITMIQAFCAEHDKDFILFTGRENGKIMSHANQMRLFNQAEYVVGPHGSAMANVIYMNLANKPKVCEFTSGTEVQVHGNIFNKNYNMLYGYLFEEIYDYYLIPFAKGSTPQVTSIDTNNLKKFLDSVV